MARRTTTRKRAKRAATRKSLIPPRTNPDDEMLTYRELEAESGLDRTTIWRRAQVDPLLRAARVQLTPTRVGWWRSKLRVWYAAQSENA